MIVVFRLESQIVQLHPLRTGYLRCLPLRFPEPYPRSSASPPPKVVSLSGKGNRWELASVAFLAQGCIMGGEV